MNVSSCTEKAPSHEQCLTADDFFQARSPYLFDDKKQSSHIEIYGRLPVDQEILLKANPFNEDLRTNSQGDTDPSSTLPLPIDQASYPNRDVPLYKGKTTWGWQKIGNSGLLKAIAEVSLANTKIFVLLTFVRVQEIIFASGWWLPISSVSREPYGSTYYSKQPHRTSKFVQWFACDSRAI